MNPFQQVINRTRAYVLEGLWDQEQGAYHEDGPCCVGAKLAACFGQDRGLWDDYIVGYRAFAEELGANKAHVLVMLREAGAGDDPFSSEPWPNDRETVWANLMKIEELPSLAGKDLRYTSFSDSPGLKGSSFREADLRHANFARADVTDACFEGANILGCSWTGGAIMTKVPPDAAGAVMDSNAPKSFGA